MQVPRLSFGLYIHHSCIPVRSNGKDVSLRRYKPVCRSTGYQENLTLSLVPAIIGTFAPWTGLEQSPTARPTSLLCPKRLQGCAKDCGLV